MEFIHIWLKEEQSKQIKAIATHHKTTSSAKNEAIYNDKNF